MDTLVSFGDWIQQRRKALDLTRNELAQRVGCSVSAIRKIEADERRPSKQIAERLAECLSVPPEQRALFLKVARGERRVEALHTPSDGSPSTPPKLKTNLPISATSLIGRAQDIESVLDLLRREDVRLLTLVGPPGIGKTRLALHASMQLSHTLNDGAYLIALAPIADADLIPSTITQTLNIQETPGLPPIDRLKDALRDKRMLLLMDNFEQVVSGAPILSDLLEACSGLKMVVTSREALRVRGEHLWQVPPLQQPDLAQALDVTQLAQIPSVSLFIDRARATRPNFVIHNENAEAVAEICVRLSGMPLAIELAAAWVNVLSCVEIAQEIERNLDFLSATMRDVPERHRSLRAAFDHSWNLMSEDERRALRRLSVFRGGMRREAAEEVSGATLALLSALVDKSLLQRNNAGRYELHELIRQYAAAHLQDDVGEQTQTHEQHTSHYANLIVTHASHFTGPYQDQVESIVALSAEIDNLRVAWEWAVTHDRFAIIQKMVSGLAWTLDLSCRFGEGLTLFEQAAHRLSRSNKTGAERDSTLGQVIDAQALFHTRQGRSGRSKELLQDAVALLRGSGDTRALASALRKLGATEYMIGDYQASHAHLLESLELCRAFDARWDIARNYTHLGLTLWAKGEYREAYNMFNDGYPLWREIGDESLIGVVQTLVTRLAQRLNEPMPLLDEARQLLSDARDLSRSMDDEWGVASTLIHLSQIVRVSGDNVQACVLLRESVQLFEATGDGYSQSRALIYLGQAAYALGNCSEARQAFLAGAHLAIRAQAPPAALDALVGLATLIVDDGAGERALQLCMVVLNHPATSHESKDMAARLRDQLEAQLTPQQIEAAHARAQSLTLEGLVADL